MDSAGGEPLTLAIESSNPSSSGGGMVALVRGLEGGRVLGTAGAREGESLAALIAGLCDVHSVSAGSLARIAVSVGPGGYTSLRIAVTTAKVIAEVGGAEVVAVPTAAALVRRVARAGEGASVAVCLAWKRRDVWVQEFAGLGAAGEGRIVALEEVGRLGVDVIVGDETLRRALIEGGVLGEDRAWAAPGFDPVAVHEASVGLGAIDPAALLPLYPREPEAVTKWRERGSSSG